VLHVGNAIPYFILLFPFYSLRVFKTLFAERTTSMSFFTNIVGYYKQLFMTKHKHQEIEKDSPYRSLFKAISWRLIASGATFIISFTIFTQATQTAYSDIVGAVSLITAVDIVAKLILYYLHERMWTNIVWGKYWRRQALKRKLKKHNKEKAKNLNNENQ